MSDSAITFLASFVVAFVVIFTIELAPHTRYHTAWSTLFGGCAGYLVRRATVRYLARRRKR